jgi:Enoyl-CoA hydratase/carnithine racemase
MPNIIYEKIEGISKITINRPEVLNAVDDITLIELEKCLEDSKKDENIRSIIITGSGRAFCVGVDLKYVKSFLEKGEKFPYGDMLRKYFHRVILSIISLPKPVIASINGVVAGAGLGIAFACDYKIASNKARFVEAFINVGLVPDSGSVYFLLKSISLPKVMEFVTLGGEIDANEAFRLGLINKLVEHEKLEEETIQIAKKYAEMPTKAIGLTKKLIYYTYHKSLEEVLEYEAYLQEIAGSTEDHIEGLKAFLEKRKPVFKGK